MGFRPSQLLKRSVRWWHWLKASLKRFDIVYIEREIFDSESFEMEERFRAICHRLVLDLDDAVFLRYPNKFERILPIFDLVVCGNSLIKDHVSLFNRSVLKIPTSIDLQRYGMRPTHQHSVRPVVGWMGTTGNLHYLQVTAEALREVAKEVPFQLRLVVPNLSPLAKIDLRGVEIDHQPWTAESEVNELQQMDVGLMPLTADQPWAHYKCAAKLLQYLAVAVPAIATPIGVNEEILASREVGFAAESTEEWSLGLRLLLSDPMLRNQMGRSGRELVQREYSVEANYPKLANALRDLR